MTELLRSAEGFAQAVQLAAMERIAMLDLAAALTLPERTDQKVP